MVYSVQGFCFRRWCYTYAVLVVHRCENDHVIEDQLVFVFALHILLGVFVDEKNILIVPSYGHVVVNILTSVLGFQLVTVVSVFYF